VDEALAVVAGAFLNLAKRRPDKSADSRNSCVNLWIYRVLKVEKVILTSSSFFVGGTLLFCIQDQYSLFLFCIQDHFSTFLVLYVEQKLRATLQIEVAGCDVNLLAHSHHLFYLCESNFGRL
jgi:hypothetical protein